MAVADILSLMRDGGISAILLWLYISERTAHNKTRDDRISDLKTGTDSLHKSISILEEVTRDARRPG